MISNTKLIEVTRRWYLNRGTHDRSLTTPHSLESGNVEASASFVVVSIIIVYHASIITRTAYHCADPSHSQPLFTIH